MNDDNRQITDVDREEVLRLVLSEAGGVDVADALMRYPRAVRGTFRNVVCEAGLVKTTLSPGDGGEIRFGKNVSLTERGRRRLNELNARRGTE